MNEEALAQAKATVRTYIQLAGQSQSLYSTESYNDLVDRIDAARRDVLAVTDGRMENPLAAPLIHTRMVVSLPDEDPQIVDACFNPMHVLCMYRAHPEV